ncbi:MAG: integrase core domain-containing protein [Pseudomonadota bacterium]|nr:integrase core domain-containing protein [Pseudomonadota bacterium]
MSEIKTVPHVPLSHPFVERVIGTVRREMLDQVPFWGARDLKRKLQHFRDYYNHGRVHASLKGVTPICSTDRKVIAPDDYRMAISLQWVVSAAGGYVTLNSPHTGRGLAS